MCDLQNIWDFKIQANKTFWNTALTVHVKDGVNLETNGTYGSNFKNNFWKLEFFFHMQVEMLHLLFCIPSKFQMGSGLLGPISALAALVEQVKMEEIKQGIKY